MQPDELVYVRHALDAARKALTLFINKRRVDLDRDELLALSLVRLMEIIGEAADRVPESFRQQHPEIPWKKMVELRDRFARVYFDVNLDMLWASATTDIPPLVRELKKLVP